MKRVIMFLIFVSTISLISADCININTASAERLDELDGIGETLAGRIIDGRPFESVDDLINVYRIGEGTLSAIKSQGLACVECDCEDDVEIEEDEKEKDGVEKEKEIEKENIVENDFEKISYNPNKDAISLVPKDIKSEEDFEKPDKEKYTKYGLAGFCVVLCLLYVSKYYRRDKNEFE